MSHPDVRRLWGRTIERFRAAWADPPARPAAPGRRRESTGPPGPIPAIPPAPWTGPGVTDAPDLLTRLVAAFDRCEASRGRFSCADPHDLRCPKARGLGRVAWECRCGADALQAAVTAARAWVIEGAPGPCQARDAKGRPCRLVQGHRVAHDGATWDDL